MKESNRVPSEINSLWPALFLLSTGWLFLLPVFTRPNYWAASALILCGVALSVLAVRRTHIEKLDRRYAVFAIPLTISAIFIPFPYNLGAALLAIGIAMGCVERRTVFIGLGLAFSGIILTVQTAVLPFYYAFAARYHSAGAASPIANLFMKAMGLQTHLNGGTVFTRGGVQVRPISVAWDKLALLPILLILLGGVLMLLFASRRKLRIITFLATVAIYALLRFVFMVLVYNETSKLSIFWNPVVTAVSLAPLFLVLVILVPLDNLPHFGPLQMKKRSWLLAGAAFLCVFLLLGAWGYQDPGIQKRGRVLIDEKHSNWERTTEKYDTKWYGEKSGYNYYCLYTYLDSYYHVERNFKPLSPTVLSRCDILLIKTPTEQFAPEEVESIERFVEGGGGLFLVSDHTNVFGMSNFINPIAKSFGLRFRYDVTYDLSTGSLTEYRSQALMPHPIVGRMPTFLFGSSCSLEAPLGADGVIVGYGLKSMYADYSERNFFPAVPETSDMDFGLNLQAAAVTHGRGRVFAFTDSTVFSNFWMFMPGKPELLLGTIQWLNRKSSLSSINLVFLLLGLVFLVITIYLCFKGRGVTAVLVVLSAGFLAVPVGSGVFNSMNRSGYPVPQPRTKLTRVCFEQEHSDFALPTLLEGFNSPAQRKYNTFYVWNQRLGYVPSVRGSLEEALADADLAVIINPEKHLTAVERRHIIRYVQTGGRLLVLDKANRKSTANEILGMFGMSIDNRPVGQQEIAYGPNLIVSTTPQACSVGGGQPIISTDDGKAIFSVARKGRGMVGVFCDSHLFCDAVLGDVSAFPTEAQVRISELEFGMLRGLIESRFGG